VVNELTLLLVMLASTGWSFAITLLGRRGMYRETVKVLKEREKLYKQYIAQLRGKLSRAMTIPKEVGEISEADIDNLLDNLPGQWKVFIQPFKSEIKKLVKENPDLIRMAKEALAKPGQQQVGEVL